MRVLYPLALLSLILSIIGAASAQDFSGLEQGIKPYGSYQGGDIDSISMVNGQLSLHIPLASYPQRGGKLRMGFSITYTNPYYQPWDNCMPPPSLCTSKNQAGYRLWYGAGGGLNAISIVPDFTVGAVAGYPPGQPPGPGQAPYDYSIIDYDGASHRMGQIANSFMSKDGTAYTLNTESQPINTMH